MKKNYVLILILTLCCSILSFGQDLIITGVFDGSLSGGTPKGVELYVLNDISDLSIYGLGSANNGGDTDGVEYTFPADQVTAGAFIYVTANTTEFNSFFGFEANYDGGSAVNINGDDAVELFMNDAVIDTYGVITVNGDDEPWDYTDGWAYRKNGTGPDGTTFEVSNWEYSGVNGLEGGTKNATATNPMPLGSYTTTASTAPELSIITPSDNEVFDASVTELTPVISIDNFTLSADNGSGMGDNSGDGYIKLFFQETGKEDVNEPLFSTTIEKIDLVPGNSYTLSLELVDNSGNSLDPKVETSVSFSAAFPCDLNLGSINTSCDALTSGTDTYSGSIDFTGGNTGIAYTITAPQGVTVGGDNPDSVTEGTITFSGMIEGVDVDITIVGDNVSSCDYTRTLFSPSCISLPISEDFSYANGSLIDNPLWDGFSGTTGDLMVTSGQVLVQHGTPSEDAQIQFAAVSGSIYYAFDFTVVDQGSPIPGDDNEYFAMFKDGGFNYRARLDIVPPASSGDFSVGIATEGGSADSVWATDFTYGVTYRVTVMYNQDSNIAKLWIDATLDSDTSILGADLDDPGLSIEGFAFRQSDSDLNEGILVDNLRIGTTFTETSLSTKKSNLEGFATYPNPVTNKNFTITSNSADSKEVAIYNILGKQVLSKNVQGTTSSVDVSQIASGLYILKVTEGNKIATSKLVIK